MSRYERLSKKERQSPRYRRTYRIEVFNIPVWATPALVETVFRESVKLGLDGQNEEASVTFEATSTSFSEHNDPKFEAFWDFLAEKMQLSAEHQVVETEKVRSIAEVEAERSQADKEAF